jgi:hypothetical protein
MTQRRRRTSHSPGIGFSDLHRVVVERLGEEVLVVGVDEIHTAPEQAAIPPTPIGSGGTSRSASISTAHHSSSAAVSATRP